MLGFDSDDRALDRYKAIAARRRVVEYEVHATLRQVVSWMNALAMPRLSAYKYVGHIGDDNVPSTVGWDVQIIEALGKTPFAYANDLYGRPAPPADGWLPCHIFTRSEVVQALGFLAPPVFRHMWADVAWMRWGQECGITYLRDVHMDHRHVTNGKAANDGTYAAAQAWLATDEHAYQRYCADGSLARDISKIREVTE